MLVITRQQVCRPADCAPARATTSRGSRPPTPSPTPAIDSVRGRVATNCHPVRAARDHPVSSTKGPYRCRRTRVARRRGGRKAQRVRVLNREFATHSAFRKVRPHSLLIRRSPAFVQKCAQHRPADGVEPRPPHDEVGGPGGCVGPVRCICAGQRTRTPSPADTGRACECL